MQARDLAGKRGEFIASERLLDFCGRRIPYFDPYLLGEKFRTEARPMAQKTSQQRRFIGERVRALAVVYLTRREDLIVTEETADVGVDLWVALNPEGKERHRKFGVELRGVWKAVTAGHANGVLYPSMQGMLRYGPFPFPVVLFFFTMENNEGWYTWVAEPVVSSHGDFEIVQHGKAACRPLDAEAIDKIVEAVDRWYDAFFARAIRETPARKRNKSLAD